MSEKFVKADFVRQISKESGLRERDVRLVVEAFFEVVCDFLLQKRDIQIRGFGTFSAKKRKRKMGLSGFPKGFNVMSSLKL